MIEEIALGRDIKYNLEVVTVTTVEEAVAFRHIGGPTVQVNGLDIEPEARSIEQFGIT